MMTALQSLRRSGSSADPLPYVHELAPLYGAGFHPRKGELVMVAARSGAAKSSFMLWLCIRFGLPALYFSADMSDWQAGVRAAAAQSGFTIDEIEQMVKRNEIPERDELNIRFCYDTSPNIGDLEDELAAYTEAWDAYPEVIVVDNLRNIYTGKDGEREGWEEVLEYLHEKSRVTKATVFVLHHTKNSEGSRNPFLPQGKASLKQQVDALPDSIITLGLDPKTQAFHVAPVKSRMSRCDETGDTYVTLLSDQARCTFSPWLGGHRYEYAS